MASPATLPPDLLEPPKNFLLSLAERAISRVPYICEIDIKFF
jgi:hypothetical protein